MTSNYFKHNYKYVVFDNFEGCTRDVFHKDEIVTFNVAAFSHYDNCYVYDFIDHGGNHKSGWSEEKDEATFLAHFRELDS